MGKKIIAFLTVVFMLLAFASCSDNEQNVYVYGDEVHTAEPQANSTETEEAEENYYEEVETTKKQVATTKKPQTTKKHTTVDNNSSSHVHRYSSATCTSPKMCNCGKTAGTALGHSYSAANCTSPKICNRCGETVGLALGHNFKNATCTSAKKCTRCGKTTGSALGHNYVNNKCSRCGKVDPDSLPVGLDKLAVIDSKDYYFWKTPVTDTYGNTYSSVHYFNVNSSYAIYNLDNKYSEFSAKIVLANDAPSDQISNINIYVDNALVYTISDVSRTTKPIKVNVDVSNSSTMKIEVTNVSYYTFTSCCCIVNAKLTK
ncbi:MAG: NPCBM/NEW2 domain-containing protein [Clostridia bacterium]|nr:NPCBM/NEW2 domain-containing protein [Clostridia bacterium]